jgi:hypothetical protein
LIAHKIEALLADKGYDADAIREELANADVEAVIPAKSNRRDPIPHDREKYRWRNLVERLFNKLKNWRRIATRYDKTKSPTSASSISSQPCNGYPLSTKPNGLPVTPEVRNENAITQRHGFMQHLPNMDIDMALKYVWPYIIVKSEGKAW